MSGQMSKKTHIRKRLRDGRKPADIAKQVGVSKSDVSQLSTESTEKLTESTTDSTQKWTPIDTETPLDWLQRELQAPFKIVQAQIENGRNINKDSIEAFLNIAEMLRELHSEKMNPRRPELGTNGAGRKPDATTADGTRPNLAERFQHLGTKT